MKYGLIKVAAAVPTVKVADCSYNLQQIECQIAQAEGKGVEIIVFPELSITGYSCQDLFRQTLLLDEAEAGVMTLLEFTRQLDIISIVGLPVVVGDLLLNCAAVIQKGQLLGIVPKTYLPNYSEFYEKRWFASAQDLRPTEIRFAGTRLTVSPHPQLFRTCDGVLFGVEVCEDVWAPVPPSNTLALAGADIIFNLSASDELIGKHDYLKSLLAQQSARTITAYVYSGCGFGESTQDVVYGGNAMIYENGRLLAEGERFTMENQMQMMQVDVERLRSERRTNSTYVNAQRNLKYDMQDMRFSVNVIECRSIAPRDFVLEREVDPLPFIPKTEDMNRSCEEIFNIQVMGLAKRLVHTNSKRVVIGISGGLDSTLALLVCVKTFDKLGLPRKGIVGVTMPGFGTTDRTYHNAIVMMRNLGIDMREISIAKSVTQHFEDIGHDINVHDVTYENSQARERTQILMDLSNKVGGLVVGTGDLSELALGWATYNGDHMSMYGVNASVPKTLVRYLVKHVAQGMDKETRKTLLDVVDTPISPELIPADEHGEIQQKTEDLVGPYELHDFFLYYFLRFGFRPTKIFLFAQRAFAGKYDDETISKWLKTFLRRFFNQQFKRSCLPDGPKVGSVSLSPRGDWRMPSDASNHVWLKEVLTFFVILILHFSFFITPTFAKQWTLQECIDYALSHNITIQKNRLTKLSAQEDVLQSKSALLPSLNASTSQNLTYRPWPETGSATVANGYVQSSIDKAYYNGSYGVNGNWIVWNGNRLRNELKLNKMREQEAELDSAINANSIQERIAQLYVQILYSAEAIKVNKASYETSKTNEERGKEFVNVGKMSKSDLAQLTTQRAQDEYNIVEAESNLRNFKRQLKQLLQITDEEEFDVVIPDYTDNMAMQEVPAMQEVYSAALDFRPEIKQAQLGIASSDLSIKIAKAQKLPTVGMVASAVTNTTSMNDTKWGTQLKNNFNLGAGFNVSVPLFDNRTSKTAVNKAMIQKQNYQLDLRDKQTALYSTIEDYWLQAVTNQNKFKAARVATESAETSYEMLNGKFQEKLINVVELMQGRDNLIQAQQNELQSKYLTILNLNLLNFYKDGQLR